LLQQKVSSIRSRLLRLGPVSSVELARKDVRFRGEAAAQRRQCEQLGRIKWYLWHGNVFCPLQTIEDLTMDVEAIEESEAQRKLLKALREFQHYIEANRPFIPNYGDRYRHGEGEAIATGFVESPLNQVVSKRMVKQQSMRWTERGAHFLLQIRTETLNDELRSTIERWYPDMKEAA
jgi:hypothetical protein